MAFLKADSSKASSGEFTPLPAGDYECFIESGAVKTATTGSQGIEFKLKVRDDVEGQKFGGRYLWGRLWCTPNTEGIVQGFVKAIGAPDGHEFATIDDLKDYAIGRAVLAKVKESSYVKNGQTIPTNEVSYMNESKVGGGKIDSPFDTPATSGPVSDDPFATGGGPVTVDDSDLPF